MRKLLLAAITTVLLSGLAAAPAQADVLPVPSVALALANAVLQVPRRWREGRTPDRPVPLEPRHDRRRTGPEVTSIRRQDRCPLDASDHLSISFASPASQYVVNALDPAHAKPVRCDLALPVLG